MPRRENTERKGEHVREKHEASKSPSERSKVNVEFRDGSNSERKSNQKSTVGKSSACSHVAESDPPAVPGKVPTLYAYILPMRGSENIVC